MNTRNFRRSALSIALLALASTAWAFTPPQTPPTSMKLAHQEKHDMSMHKSMGMHGKMKGMHGMPGTVTAVDHATGVVHLKSLGMDLVVHFPPPSIKGLKTGDKIRLMLGYRITSH